MELILHKVCGHPAQQAVTLRRCTPDEAPAVYALQNEVHAAMPHPEWFVTDTLEHITGYITDSLCIGVWQGSRLGAYLTFHYCGQSPHNYAAFLGVPQAEWPHWANADSAVVHPDWRGNGLQRRMLAAATARKVPTFFFAEHLVRIIFRSILCFLLWYALENCGSAASAANACSTIFSHSSSL